VPSSPARIVLESESVKLIGVQLLSSRGEVNISNDFVSRSSVPGFARPSISEWFAVSAAQSSAMKYAARLPLPAHGPLPKYSAMTPTG
jgi:hypothetical protein